MSTQTPLFWYRPVCNGEMYEGPVHHDSVGGKMLRDEKPGEWVPLYAESPESTEFKGPAERKLNGLLTSGYGINGVAIRNDATGQQGFVTNGGVVGWWRPENDAQMIKAKCDELAKDAARYRWLAAYARSTSEHWGGRWSLVIDGPAPKSHDSEDDLDAAIDAAIAKAEGKEGGAA